MNVRPFLSFGLELDVETYIAAEGTKMVSGSLRLAVAGLEGYRSHKFFNSDEAKALFESFSANSVDELVGHSVYALYKDRKLVDVLRRG